MYKCWNFRVCLNHGAGSQRAVASINAWNPPSIRAYMQLAPDQSASLLTFIIENRYHTVSYRLGLIPLIGIYIENRALPNTSQRYLMILSLTFPKTLHVPLIGIFWKFSQIFSSRSKSHTVVTVIKNHICIFGSGHSSAMNFGLIPSEPHSN